MFTTTRPVSKIGFSGINAFIELTLWPESNCYPGSRFDYKSAIAYFWQEHQTLSLSCFTKRESLALLNEKLLPLACRNETDLAKSFMDRFSLKVSIWNFKASPDGDVEPTDARSKTLTTIN